MKYLVLIVLSVVITSVFAQTPIPAKRYDLLKASGQINPTDNYKIIVPNYQGGLVAVPSTPTNRSGSRAAGDCNCYNDPDISYTLALPPNDDGSTVAIPLPFTFCFYGTTQNSVYINTNGNISFGQPYSTYSGQQAFPDSNFIMIAPFWGDVDTRLDSNGVPGGEIWYKITPTSLVVNWVGVGYFDRQNDKRNTFQLIITDGTDSQVPNGNNVAFCYKDMEWTTGSAPLSQGVNGFGGFPAIVGANLGNGIDFIQFGLFDTAGTVYDGPYMNNDGVSWLDNQSMYFNGCSSSNTPPIVTGLNSCDTIGVCRGDTLNFNMSFISPEQSQITTVTVNSTMPGLTVVNNTPGTNASVDAYVVGGLTNVGYHNVQFVAVDNGTPAETTYVDLVIFVDSNILNPVITSSDSTLCIGDSTTLDVGTGYDSYVWSTGDIDTNLITAFTGLYFVTVTKGLCEKSSAQYDVVTIDPQPSINTDLLCAGDSLALFTLMLYDSVNWSTGATSDTLIITSPGSYSIQVSYFGCLGEDTVTIMQVPIPFPTITGDTFYCQTDSVVLITQNWDSIIWSNGDTSMSTQVGAGNYTVTVFDTNNCRNTTSPFTVVQSIPNPAITGDTVICDSSTIPIMGASSNVGFRWSTTETSQVIQVGQGTYSLTVTNSFGCTDSSTYTVIKGANPVVNFSFVPKEVSIVDQNVVFTDLSTISNGIITSWNWSFGDGDTSSVPNPEHVYLQTGKYSILLLLTSNFGCTDTATHDIKLIEELIGPNVMTPNGDFMNDFLIFPSLEYFPPGHLQVFNRWGVLLYEANPYQNNWDAYGIADGTYYYILSIPEIDRVLRSDFTIISGE